MNLQPVKSYKTPQYPDKKIIFDNPDILKSVPKRWNKSVSTQIAFSSLLLMTLTACGPKNYSSDNTGSKEASVAPIFEHGDGIGGYGCVSVAPPAFLSEEEAYQIINDEVKKMGIDFKEKSELLKNVLIPVTYSCPIKYVQDPDNPEQSIAIYPSKTKKAGNLELDGYDNDKNIAFEFVSVDDFKGWLGESGVLSSYEDYNCLDAAKTLREGVTDKTSGKYIGVFYDPISRLTTEEYMQEDSIKKRKALSKELLRQQITDFIEWLKAEGVI